MAAEAKQTGQPKCIWPSLRHGVIVLSFLMGALLYSLRFNLSIAIVAMAEQDNVSLSDVNISSSQVPETVVMDICPTLLSQNETFFANTSRNKANLFGSNEPKFASKFSWNEKDQGLILGSFFWGYVLSQFPSGLISQKYGPKWVMGLGLLFAGLLGVAIPQAAIVGGRDAVILIRILQGVSEGFTIPALFILLSKWTPPQERARLSAISFAGMPFGAAVTMIISGPLITTLGWPSVFYLPGALSICWFIYWTLRIHSSPEEHPNISLEELNFIQESKKAELAEGKPTAQHQPVKMSDVPWRKIACSGPVWAVFISQFFNCWGHNMLKTQGPKYLHSALHFDIHSNGYLSSLPDLFQCFFVMGIGRLSDFLIERKLLSMLAARRFCNTLGQWGSALSFAGIILSGCNRPIAVFCYVMSGMVNGAMLCGSIDISPNYSGPIEGVINSAANIAGFGAPFVAGLILYNEPSMIGWSFVFLIPVISNLIGNLAFLLGSSVKPQPWDEIKKEERKLEA